MEETQLEHQTFPAWQDTAPCFLGKCYSHSAFPSLLSRLASVPGSQCVGSLLCKQELGPGES